MSRLSYRGVVKPTCLQEVRKASYIVGDRHVDGRATAAADADLFRHLHRVHRLGQYVAAPHADVVVRAVAANGRAVGILLERGPAAHRHFAFADLSHPHGPHPTSELTDPLGELGDQGVEDSDYDALPHRRGFARYL